MKFRSAAGRTETLNRVFGFGAHGGVDNSAIPADFGQFRPKFGNAPPGFELTLLIGVFAGRETSAGAGGGLVPAEETDGRGRSSQYR
jgi:hypothetical protein